MCPLCMPSIALARIASQANPQPSEKKEIRP